MHNQMIIIEAIAMGIAILAYLITLFLVSRYMKRAKQIPAKDHANSLAGLLDTVRQSVRWGTLISWISFVINVLLWLFGKTAQQEQIVTAMFSIACGLFIAALVFHLVCSMSLSTMKGDSERPAFARAARKLPNRLLVISVIQLIISLYLGY